MAPNGNARHVLDQPTLLPELSRLLGVAEIDLVKEIVPHVIGWLCVHQKREELQVIQTMLTYLICLFTFSIH